MYIYIQDGTTLHLWIKQAESTSDLRFDPNSPLPEIKEEDIKDVPPIVSQNTDNPAQLSEQLLYPGIYF